MSHISAKGALKRKANNLIPPCSKESRELLASAAPYGLRTKSLANFKTIPEVRHILGYYHHLADTRPAPPSRAVMQIIAKDLEQLWNVKFSMPSVSRAGITKKLNEVVNAYKLSLKRKSNMDFFMPFDILNKNIKLKREEQIFYNHQMDDRKSCVLTSQTVVEHPANRQLIQKNMDLDYVEQLYTESSSENDDNVDDFQPLFERPKRKFKSKVSNNNFWK